jgi:hypothetical protein
MRHFERRIWDDQKSIYAYVYRIPCPSVFFKRRGIVPRARRWKPLVEFDGATYEGNYNDNVYSQYPRGPGMGPFYFAQGVPEQ